MAGYKPTPQAIKADPPNYSIFTVAIKWYLFNTQGRKIFWISITCGASHLAGVNVEEVQSLLVPTQRVMPDLFCSP